jgi:hypothetical protein
MAERDLTSLVAAFDERWNAHDEEGVLGFFTDDAVVRTTPPMPGGPDAFNGKEEIRGFVSSLMPGFHVDSRNHRVEGNKVMWDSTLESDAFRQMGVDTAEATTEATFRGDKIEAFYPTFSPETVARMQEAMGGAET